MIGGFSDERGAANYNVELGLKRANAVRDRLVAAGIDSDRIRVVSYGKGAQVCTVASEACWQQNRRAAFMIQP
jgi:peptidoglycan-associated lipoprotein